MTKFLVVDDEPADLSLLQGIIERMGHEAIPATTAKQALEVVRNADPDAVILDILLPDENGLEVYNQMRSLRPKMPIIFVTASGSSNTAIEAMQLGALDYLTKPLQVPQVKHAIERAVQVVHMTKEPVAIDPPVTAHVDGDVIIGRSPAMQEVYKAIGLVASQDVTVLIRGESGTGKELVARAIYQFSKRSEGPFLAVNCAAIPEPLLESELFGHEKGAFTGADRRRIGKFEQCNRGSLFMDEIGDMPLLLQSKILRVLQDGSFQRVGGNQTIKTDVRVIAATHRDLETMVQRGEFREDLLYRLNGFTINLPPLRERGDDIELLVDYFRRQANRDLGKHVQGFSPEAMELLRSYSWPGNVRELQNIVRQAVLISSGPVVIPEFIPEHLRRRVQAGSRVQAFVGQPPTTASESVSGDDVEVLIEQRLRAGSNQVYDEVVSWVEEKLVEHALAATGGDKLAALRRLGINPMAFRSMAAMKLLELNAPAAAPARSAPEPERRADSPQTHQRDVSGNGDRARNEEAAAPASASDHVSNRQTVGYEQDHASRGSNPSDIDVLIRPGMTMEEIEREAIRRALKQTGGKRTKAAQLLGISVRTLQRKIKEYALDPS